MSRPTVAQAESWNPDALRETADDWDSAAMTCALASMPRSVRSHGSRDFWSGSAAEAARGDGATISASGALATRCLITAAAAARDGATQMGSARSDLLAVLSRSSPLAASLTGGSARVAAEVLDTQIEAALDRLGAADVDCASDIIEALNPKHAPKAQTTPAGAWPVPLSDVVAGWSAIGQDRIANQIEAMTPDQRQRLIDGFPKQVGNTDGVPWDMRAAANRINIAQTIADERRDDGPVRSAGSRSIRACSPRWTTRRAAAAGGPAILAFDPARASLVELNGDLRPPRASPCWCRG